MNILNGQLPKSANYRSGRSGKNIQYIVIHYTANKGDTALNNINYFANNTVKASAHYFVDESHIYTSVPVRDTAWHCGGKRQSSSGGKWYEKCTNANSIGIEMCLWDKAGNIRENTVNNTIELTKYLMSVYNIPAENVIRHWDVNGKYCPQPFIGDDNTHWQSFKQRLTQPVKMEENKTMIYNTVEEVPEYARPTIQKLCDKGFLKGNETGLNLSMDMIRIFVVLDRTGVFG